jgi:hypothetical protein
MLNQTIRTASKWGPALLFVVYAVQANAAVVRLRRDSKLLDDLTNCLTLGNLDLGFTQLADDLLRLKTVLGHSVIPLFQILTRLEF